MKVLVNGFLLFVVYLIATNLHPPNDLLAQMVAIIVSIIAIIFTTYYDIFRYRINVNYPCNSIYNWRYKSVLSLVLTFIFITLYYKLSFSTTIIGCFWLAVLIIIFALLSFYDVSVSLWPEYSDEDFTRRVSNKNWIGKKR